MGQSEIPNLHPTVNEPLWAIALCFCQKLSGKRDHFRVIIARRKLSINAFLLAQTCPPFHNPLYWSLFVGWLYIIYHQFVLAVNFTSFLLKIAFDAISGIHIFANSIWPENYDSLDWEKKTNVHTISVTVFFKVELLVTKIKCKLVPVVIENIFSIEHDSNGYVVRPCGP